MDVHPGADDAASPRVAPRLVHELRHAEVVSGLDLSPDGEVLASVSADGAVVLWRVATGTPLGPPLEGGFRLKPPSRMHPRALEASVAFSPRGDRLVFTGGGRVAAWDLATRKTAFRAEGLDVSRAAFSPDGRLMALATRHGLLLVDLASGKVNASCATGGVTAVAFSPDGRTVAALGRRGLGLCRDPEWAPLIVPSVRAGRLRITEPDLAFSPDGRTIAWGGTGADSVALVDTATRRTREIALHFINSDMNGVHQVTFSPDGAMLAVLQMDGDIEFWRLTEPPQRVAALLRKGDLYGARSHSERDLSFSEDGRRLAYGEGRCTSCPALGGSMTVRDLDTLGDQRRPVIEIPGAVLKLSSSWRVGATADSRVVSVWDLEHQSTGSNNGSSSGER
jgi:WD40 repeat protein